MKLLQHKYWWLLLLAGFGVLLYLSTNVHTKFDLTKEKKFSISNATKDILKNLNDKVEIQVLLDGNLSSGYKKLKIATQELLDDYRTLSNGKLSYTVFKPDASLPDSVKAILYDSLEYIGARPVNYQANKEEGEKVSQIIFPYAIIKYGDNSKVINLESGKSGMDEESSLNYSEALLEFKFSDAINKLTTTTKPFVAFALGNDEPLENGTTNDLIKTIATNNFRIGPRNLNTQVLNADSVQALIIVKPSKPFTEIEKIKIDQYIMQGGKVIWCIDRLYAEYDSLLRNNQTDFIAFDKNLELDDILFHYGVRINSNLVQDLNSAFLPVIDDKASEQHKQIKRNFFYYPLLSGSSQHPLSKNLDQLLSIFPSSIDTVQAKGITKTILLTTDTNSRIVTTPNLVSLQNVRLNSEQDYHTFNQSHLPVAVLLEGKFTSLFTNRLTQAGKDTAATYTGIPFIANAAKASKQIIVSDADLVTNAVSGIRGALPMGMLQFDETEYQFANKEFLLNCLDYMVGNAAIIETRNKDYTLRLLDKTKVKAEKTFWQGFNVALPLIIILILALVMQWLRKRRFAV